MSGFRIESGVTYSCDNGGTITSRSDLDDLNDTGVDEDGAYFNDVYIDAYNDMTVGVKGNGTTAILQTKDRETIMKFTLNSRYTNGRCDLTFVNLEPKKWYRVGFDNVLAKKKYGISHDKADKNGKVTFKNIIIENV